MLSAVPWCWTHQLPELSEINGVQATQSVALCYSSWTEIENWAWGVGCCYNTYPQVWKQLWNWVVGVGWKSLKVVLGKAYSALNGPLMAIQVPAQKEKRAGGKVSLFLENANNREQNVGRSPDDKDRFRRGVRWKWGTCEWTMEKRWSLLVKWQRTWLTHVRVPVFCGR